MKAIKHLCRVVHISLIFSKHGLDEILFIPHLFRPLRFLSWLSFARWNGRMKKSKGVRIREALEELGPIFVKFGQLLSTRYDILPEDILLELIKLQDQVVPFSGILAKEMVEMALEQPIENIFQHFDITPLASASIAQVHSAILLDGQAVVIKILRPRIYQIIKQDVALLKMLASLCHRYSKKIRPFKPRELVTEFEKTLLNELDLMREAANASQLKRNFQASSLLYIPEIHWKLTKTNILTMERIYGIPISNRDLLQQHGFDLKQLAKLMLEVFFTQLFRDSFFHADMHPGNILVATENIADPKLIFVDFGIIGILSPSDQHYLAENIFAFLNRDYRRVALLHVESRWVPRNTRLDEFEAAIRTICEPLFEQSLKEISFDQTLFRLLQMASHYQVNIQPQLILLQKTLLHIEGISRHLDPNIDLWGTAKPFLEIWMKKQMGIPSLLRKLKTHAPYWLEKLPLLPNLLYTTLTQLAEFPNTEEVPSVSSSTAGLKSSLFSLKDIWIGFLLGLSLSLVWLVIRSYF